MDGCFGYHQEKWNTLKTHNASGIKNKNGTAIVENIINQNNTNS
jgi:hypothetical protein